MAEIPAQQIRFLLIRLQPKLFAVPNPPRSLSLLALLAVSSPAFAGIDSGGGMSSGGGIQNHCSIGSSFATLSSRSGETVNHPGLIEVIYRMTSSSITDFDPVADADRDGNSNLMEYLAGTDPGNSNSVFRPQGDYAGGVYQMPIPTVSGRDYHVWASRDLKNWTLYRTLRGNNALRLFEFDETSIVSGPLYSSSHPSNYFFRIQITLPDFDSSSDTDQDGTSDQMEYLAGTDPKNAASVFRPQGIYEDGMFRMPIPTIFDRHYQIWISRDLQNWVHHSSLNGNGSIQLFQFDETTIDSGPLYSDIHPSAYFFRIQILIP